MRQQHQEKRLVPRKLLNNSNSKVATSTPKLHACAQLHPCYTQRVNNIRYKNMNFIDVLNAATTELSDNKLSKKLGIKRQTVSTWRNRGSIPTDDILDQLAEISNIPVAKVYFAAYADKIHNPIAAAAFRESSHLAA